MTLTAAPFAAGVEAPLESPSESPQEVVVRRPSQAERRRRRRTRLLRRWWRSPDVGIGVAALLGALIVQTWFRPGRFVAAGDTGPFLQGLEGVTRSWTHSLTGSGSTGYRAASLPEGVVHDAVTALGLSHTFAQRAWFTLVVALCGAAVAWLAAAFTRYAASTAAAGAVAVLAPFHLTTLPNLLPSISIIAVALVCGWAVRTVRGRPVPAPAAVALGVAFAPLSKNPPLLVMVGGVLAAAVAAVLWRRRGALRHVLCALAWLAAASLCWVVPLALHFALGTPGLEVVAQTDVDAWSWTHRNSGPANVVRLVASWVWGDEDVLGPLARRSEGWWAALAWALPVAVVCGAALARSRRAAAALLAGCAVLVALCSGLNAPFGGLNRFLYDHVPGFWLFRQPMAKFGVLLVVAYAALVAAGVHGLITRSRSWTPHLRRVAMGSAALLACAVLAFAQPLWTGSVVQGQRGGENRLPPERVALPDGWHRAADWLERAPRRGGVAVLPLSDYYQQGTSWGFYGVNDLVSRLVSRPAWNVLPGGYYEAAGAVPELLDALQDALVEGDGVGATRLMDSLGVAYLVVRTDLTTVPTLPTADGADLAAAAEGLPELRSAAVFDEVTIYEATEAPRPTVRRPIEVRRGLGDERWADLAAVTPGDAVLVEGDGDGAHADAWRPAGGETSYEVTTDRGTYRVGARIRGPLLWGATAAARGPEGARVELSLRSTMAVDGVDLFPPVHWSVPAAGEVVGLVVDGQPIALRDGAALFEARPGTPVRPLTAGDPLPVDSPERGRVGNCDNPEGLDLVEARIGVGGGPDGRVVLSARSGAACFSVPLPTAPAVLGSKVWHVRGSFERLRGASTRVCVWLPNEARCASGTPPATTDPTGTFDFLAVAHAGQDARDASLVLYADHDGVPAGDEVATVFRDVAVAPVQVSPEVTELPAVRSPSAVRGDAGGGVARFTIDDDLARNLLQPFGDRVKDCNNHDGTTVGHNGLRAERRGTGADAVLALSAVRHSACVDGRVDVPAGVRHLTVELEYRAPRSGARWCLLTTSTSCTAGGSLGSSEGWTTVSTDVVVPEGEPAAAAGAHRLYLYADGPGRGEPDGDPVQVEYRRVSVRPTYPLVGVIRPTDSGSGGQGVVVATEAYSEHWRYGGPAEVEPAAHLRVDGWANGWVVPRGTDPRVEARFVPDRAVALAVWSLPVVLAAAGGWLLLQRRRGPALRPRPGGPR